jgi:DNA-binding IclR family transcriptional regulator
MDEKKPSANGQVVNRTARILEALADHGASMTSSQLARATALPRTTVHRLATALESQGMLLAGEDGFHIGPAIARYAAAAHADIRVIARPHIESLGRRTRETVDLCVYRGRYAILVDQYPSDQELRVISPMGTAFPIHVTAHGKALLAALPAERVRSVLPERLDQYTPATITRRDHLIKHLEAVRVDGLAIDHEEHADGVCGLGIALDTGAGERYAVSVALPARRFEAKHTTIRTALEKCRAEIEAAVCPDTGS